ncbi:VPS9 domain protein [Aspergillus luchuensis]|uniref:VPS9 domain protein n=1 Tax=Aspergillus kawachii TaxID=1069201 RepID=A0A146F7C9_ASPKA|nr:VPS9 domain protein [Aspergillus luchuensis]
MHIPGVDIRPKKVLRSSQNKARVQEAISSQYEAISALVKRVTYEFVTPGIMNGINNILGYFGDRKKFPKS